MNLTPQKMKNKLLLFCFLFSFYPTFCQLVYEDVAKFSDVQYIPEDVSFELTITPEKLYCFELKLNDSLTLTKLFRKYPNTYVSIYITDNDGRFHGNKVIVDSIKGEYSKDYYVHGKRTYLIRKSFFTGDTTELLEQYEKNGWIHIEARDGNKIVTQEDSHGLPNGYKKFYYNKSEKIRLQENYKVIAYDSISNMSSFLEEYPFEFYVYLQDFKVLDLHMKSMVKKCWKNDRAIPQIKSGDYLAIRYGDWIYYDEKGRETKRENYSFKTIKFKDE
jgi:hypothetical protein